MNEIQILAGNRRTLTWTVELEPGSAVLSTADIVVLRTARDGTVTTEQNVTITDTVDGGTVVAVVEFADTLPAGKVTFRLDSNDVDGDLLAVQQVFYVTAASAQRPTP